MSTAGKVIITISICLILLVVGLVGAGAYWWSTEGRKMVEAGGNAVAEGEEAGKKTDNQGCVDQTLARYKANQGLSGTISSNLFLVGCLQRSTPTPGFCDDVPRTNEVMRSASWQIQKCKDAGLPADPYARQIFAVVQQHCERARFKPKQ